MEVPPCSLMILAPGLHPRVGRRGVLVLARALRLRLSCVAMADHGRCVGGSGAVVLAAADTPAVIGGGHAAQTNVLRIRESSQTYPCQK